MTKPNLNYTDLFVCQKVCVYMSEKNIKEARKNELGH